MLAPNPIKNNLFVGVGGEDREIEISIFSSDGKEIFKKQYTLETSRTVQLDVSDLPKGSFIVKAKGNTIHTSELLIKE